MKMRASKIHGALVGALLGDCLGAPFEGDVGPVSTHLYKKYFEGLKADDSSKKLPYKAYTDDTAMTMMVAESLVLMKGFDPADMARRFADEYFKDPRRGYGGSVAAVFMKLRKNFSNASEGDLPSPFEPAAQQFNGSGSYGNGGAMRVAPVAAMFGQDLDRLKKVAVDQARLTHANALGFHGALVQCLAVAEAMKLDPDAVVGAKEFCEKLMGQIRPAEDAVRQLSSKSINDMQPTSDEDLPDSRPYCAKLRRVVALDSKFRDRREISTDIVIRDLGNDVSALDSVPTAVFCYLMSQKDEFESFQAESQVERAMQMAISLGGDTDTIASMAAAIAGAHSGRERIPESLLKHCEARDRVEKLAEQLSAIVPECSGDVDKHEN